MTTAEQLECTWCGLGNAVGASNCSACGAPLGGAVLRTESGWRPAPRLNQLTEISFGSSRFDVQEGIVPVVEVELGAGDEIYFEPELLNWWDESLELRVRPLTGLVQRLMAGMPLRIADAAGPGRLAISRESTGDLVLMPIRAGARIEVREHAFLLATSSLDYEYDKLSMPGSFFGTRSMYLDRFFAQEAPGLLILHGFGCVFDRVLEADESIVIEPGAFFYKEDTVRLQGTTLKLGGSLFGRNVQRLHATGPGRIGLRTLDYGWEA